ncbi:DNA polymerase-3 subunit alpha [Oribacterium sp. KHPX15]|uniref:PolC-type DNA polymerase III n=1 Tax=Oribacterium sp. KHPX15 TaxID=1855342 RepID=UPI00089622B5|nr:PolC-type DNA polymerase III [Oribacterium sp. KHPX15]SEA70611.1 DNA polymerase-3 subunit alpha [Oribacterium sp. KHPX15]
MNALNEDHKVSVNTSLVYGRRFEGKAIPVSEIYGEMQSVIVEGRVFCYERRPIRNDKALLTFGITDLKDSIKVKLFITNKEIPAMEQYIRDGAFLRIKGSIVYDFYDKEICLQKITGIMTMPNNNPIRKDHSEKKRVELHCHTKKSALDGVSDVSDLIKQAYDWGMPALAITDHAVVQALTEGYQYICSYKNKHKDSDIDKFKLILGVEGYLVDDYGNELNDKDLEGLGKDTIKHLPSSHVVILARNETGRINLYKLISESHLNYFYRKPLIPKSLLANYRDGLIIGSACCAGELYKAILAGEDKVEIKKIVDFYDYLEIQPVSNNYFMIPDEKYTNIKSEDDLRSINMEIVRLGEIYGKPVVATSDAHYLNPEDGILREVILTVKGMDEEPAPLYLRTTDEMLSEFKYLGEDKAREVVIENTNHIADLCEHISPVRPDKCPPVIKNSDETLRNVCYEKIHSLYGDMLPTIVEDRLEKELNSIIGNGYASLYAIARKLVEKSVQKGYLVGSRGSVGSSFAAFASGITEVNPLPPHYLCPKCKYSDFLSEDVAMVKGGSGYDLPDKICPVCGTPLRKDGFDIPFEIFLGFDGDKEPDIDLNFSGRIQSTIHKYTEEIFGKGNCFKAGTISSLGPKTAYGYVKKYLEIKGISKRSIEIQRLVDGFEGVKNGTGQHPGGIVILPKGENIYSFTPLQYPANDSNSYFITTHFDYHSIDHNLLKLDLLGHDDPTMLRFLNDITGVNSIDVPFNDDRVMALFKGTDVLDITPDQIGGTKVGTIGLPEFGTDFAMSMILDAKPQMFSDLVRLAGLSHGTDVWLGNAKDLIYSGITTLRSCICCRDDIMTYLIEKGIDKSTSFRIMESVRKGKGLSGQMETAMKEAGIPEWYMDSCRKIKYMFPKAHAAAYVMMACRIAYFKIYYPQAFYAAWFSIRANSLNYEKMFCGHDVLEEHLAEYRSKKYLTASESDEYTALRVAEEMYARNIEIAPIDLKMAHPSNFTIVGERVMPSFSSICGLGEKAGEMIVNELRIRPFSSISDFKKRTKCSQMVIDTLLRLGLLKDLPNPKQLSIFDFME